VIAAFLATFLKREAAYLAVCLDSGSDSVVIYLA
jgi:hypothetical protein